MARHRHATHSHLREHIAQLAARLVAEGTEDFALAKRKAARQLGTSDTQNLPDNSEIEQALRAYQALYQHDDQIDILRKLRLQALRAMQAFVDFDPLLIGSVLRGTATAFSNINLALFADSTKDVELLLLNRNLDYKASEKHFRFRNGLRPIPVLLLSYAGEAAVQLAIFATSDRRSMPLSPIDGRVMSGAPLTEVEALLDQ